MNRIHSVKYVRKQLRDLRSRYTSFSSRTTPKTTFIQRRPPESDLVECPICCDSYPVNALKEMPCCQAKSCSSCLIAHTVGNIRNGKAKIECPACSQEINPNTILYNSEIPLPLRERYQELLAQSLLDQKDMFVKLCPHCNLITILDENDPRIKPKKSRRSDEDWVRCEQCDQRWCWSCYSPAHPDDTCRNFRKNQSDLDIWAKLRRQDKPSQRNAQRCPKCSIYIEKIDGCDHMQCGKCNSKFCYSCGARMRLPNYIGHDAKYSIFGCKYKLWPNRPFLRRLVRGSIFGGVLLLTPVALGVIVVLVAIGVPVLLVVGCFALPVYCCAQCKKDE